MALEGEFSELYDIVCPDCGKCLRTEVLQSNAGFYLGHFCSNCGPYDRQTEYMTEDMAKEMLNLWETMDTTPLFTRSTDFND